MSKKSLIKIRYFFVLAVILVGHIGPAVAQQITSEHSSDRNIVAKTPVGNQGVIFASDFGVVCDGKKDATAALQLFLSTIRENMKGVLPSGICNFSSTLVVTAGFNSLSGEGAYSTILNYIGTSTNTDLISISGISPTNLVGGVASELEGFGVRSSTILRGGAALHIKRAGHITLREVNLGAQYDHEHNLWNGIYFDQTDFQRLEGFELQVQNEALMVSGNGPKNPGPQYDLYVDGGKISGSKIGVHLGGGFDNAYFDRIMVTYNQNNVVIDNSLSPYPNQDINFGPQFSNEYSLNDGILINDTLASDSHHCQIVIFGEISESRKGSGINIKSWPKCHLEVMSGYIGYNFGSGISIADGSVDLSVNPATQFIKNGKFAIDLLGRELTAESARIHHE